MGIDRIGKGSGGVPVSGPEASGAGDVSKPAADFKVGRAAASAPAQATSLDRLRAGEISVSEYLDIQIQNATAHLEGRLSTEQLGFIRDNLREQLSSDPMLADLVKSTTGALPPARE